MFGNGLYIATIETVYDAVRTSRTLLVPAIDRAEGNLKVSMYLMDLNWPFSNEFKPAKRQWYISEPLEEIDLLTLMSSPGAVRLGKDVELPFSKYVPATDKESLAFKKEDDINPDIDDDVCADCEQASCFTCLFAYDEMWYDFDDLDDLDIV